MTRLIVAVAVIVSFCAGAMVDHVVRGRGAPPGPHGPGGGPGGYIANQLSLSADQQAKMKDIWQNTFRRGGQENRAKRDDLRKHQEQSIAALIRPEDKPAYDKIVADTKSKMEAMDAEGKKAFDDAVARTKQILTPEQLKKYEQIIQRPWDHHDHDRPATRPGDR